METARISSTINNSLIALLLFYSSFLAFSQAQPTNTSIVLDLDGNQLQSNTKYYILPLPNGGGGGGGGGLALSIRDHHNPCPPNVVQENGETSPGLSLKLFPADGSRQNQATISLHGDVNVVFMAATVCVQRTVWQLGNAEGTARRRYVRTNGMLGRPGAETVGNWFRIETYGKGYKIVYCPSVCSECRVGCGDVGVFVEHGRRWLGLGGQPLGIVFKKA